MINDYKNWYIKKSEFINHLKHHDSIIINRVNNVIITLNYIASLKEEELNEDYDVIFDCGYGYIYNTISEMELYLDKYFDNNMHKFLDYEPLINYSLFLNDLKSTLIEQEVFDKYLNEEFNNMINEIENIIMSKKSFDETIIESFDNNLFSMLEMKKEYITTSEVFDRIAEELQIV